jgi:hypothetical protein
VALVVLSGQWLQILGNAIGGDSRLGAEETCFPARAERKATAIFVTGPDLSAESPTLVDSFDPSAPSAREWANEPRRAGALIWPDSILSNSEKGQEVTSIPS